MSQNPVNDNRDARLAAEELVNPTAHFLDEWIDNHVGGSVSVPPGIEPAAELARQCVRDAAKQGIEAEQLEEEVGDLKEYIADVLTDEHAADEAASQPPPAKAKLP